VAEGIILGVGFLFEDFNKPCHSGLFRTKADRNPNMSTDCGQTQLFSSQFYSVSNSRHFVYLPILMVILYI
jgi:hypothetical protein